MDDFANLLQRDYGLKPQGKSAPIGSSRAGAPYVPPKASSSQGGSLNRGNNGSTGLSTRTSKEDALGDDMFFGSTNLSNKTGKNASAMADSGFGSSKSSFDDVFGDSLSFGVSKQPSKASTPAYDDIFSPPIMPSTSKSNSYPVYDMPKYDDDIFGGVPGIRRNSSAPYEDVFGMGTSKAEESTDLLRGFAVTEPSRSKSEAEQFLDASSSALEDLDADELLPGFGSSMSSADAKPSHTPIDNPLFSVGGSTSRSSEIDPFRGLTSDPIGLGNSSSAASSAFVDPLEDPFEIRFPQAHDSADINLKPKENAKNTVGNDVFDGIFQSKASEIANVHSRSSKTTIAKDDAAIPPVADYVYSNAMNHNDDHFPQSPPRQETNDLFSSSEPVFANPKKKSVRFDKPKMKNEVPELSQKSTSQDSLQRTMKEVWVTIDDVRLVTKPTKALPPSRPAPRFDFKKTYGMRNSEFKTNTINHSEVAQDFLNETSSRLPTYHTSSIEDLENFASGRFHPEGNPDLCYDEEHLSATKLKEASERFEGRLKSAKEGREKDREVKDREAKAAKSKEREEREEEARIIQQREAKEEEAREGRENQRRETEREREKDRAAVDRATHEARERAAEKALAEAREKAERAAAEARQRAERIAVERVTAEARDRAAAEAREKAATEAREQAAAEARERAAADGKQRAERAAVERATAEARGRAERAAVERANAEARERAAERAAAAEARERAEKAAERATVQRAAAEARERAEKAAAQRAASAAAAQAQQQRSNDNDLEQFFNVSSSRAASAPKQRPSTSESVPEYKGRSTTAAPTVRKVSSTTNIVDDWTSIFATPSTAEFQEVDGEAPERRKARWERYQRTLERSAKALAEKNQRDLDAQREQAEKHRVADTLDAEIRRWAAGKEGNLRALLSTLQYVLWPESGWQPVSLTDLITGASVKKVYRKATLYVHPDKVQQKGATVQQKYVAEKVFDLLKEAWNKFNSEELF